MTKRNAVRRSVPAGALPDFTPVPRKSPRHDGWTPERQRAFIEALADTGCVAIAARMVNMSQAGVYQLRRQPGAEGFRAAMDAAQTLGLQPVKDEAFDRAMNGQLVPVFVAGKLMGFRRKKNDRLLMFILRHYGQDASGRRTTINYFSSRATAGAAAQSPSPLAGEGDSRGERGEGAGGAAAAAAAEASTTTVRTIISGPGNATTRLAEDESAANILNAFEGVPLDAEAQAEIYRTLTACAERRRALEADPQDDPQRSYVGAAEAGAYLGELESGVEGDWVEYRPGACPEQGRGGEHLWENLGEGGEAERIDEVLAGMAERRAKLTPEEIAAEKAGHEAEVRRMREQQTRALPAPKEPDPDDPRLDWRNWTGDGYVAPSATPAHPEPVEGPISPRTGKPLKRYRKRTPKPAFTPADEARKAEATAETAVERRVAAAAEAERRKKRQR
ncbi:MAG TPA: hypothetical protein VEW25_14225 [Allosphingosinicella sp.]|nr:hypothetical protein [Allosphingosinicella sp.]